MLHFAIKSFALFILVIRNVESLASPKFNRRTFCEQYITKRIVSVGTAYATITLTSNSINKNGSKAEALDENDRSLVSKPFAPVEALLPATRLKLWTDQAYGISSILGSITNKDEKYLRLKELDSLLSSRPQLFLSEKIQKRTIGSTAQVTSAVSRANKDEYQMNRKGFNVGDKFAAMLNQADVERQWGMLQYAESKREEANEMRAALNFYTQQLNFGDKFQLTATKEERKKMIRNDEIPSLAAVITSDLDLRDLYRNEFLTAIEDAQAEVAYQVKQSPSEIDTSDSEELMNQAYVALSKWFGLISGDDVLEAVSLVKRER